tara:strand:+ start:156 stop:905 length:750 start_codon:yes stop_codon:yes gene_type:complete
MQLNYRFLFFLFFSAAIVFFLIVKTIDFSLKKYTRHNDIILVPSLIGLNLNETEDTLQKMDLQYVILDSAAYNPNYDRGSILSHQPKAHSQVKPGRKIYLTINPITVNYIPLPYLKNKSLRQAISLLENHAFRVGDLHYVDYYAKDVVRFAKVNQKKVNSNDSLPKFTIVDLYMGNGHDQNIVVPNLIDLEYHEIKRKLNYNSLNLGSCVFANNITDTATAIIYKQDPEANIRSELGSYINIWLKDSLN